MRIMSFNQKWLKLQNAEFTTFRYFRLDKDWWIGEQIQIFYKARSKDRQFLGIAEIIDKERRELDLVFPDNLVPLVIEAEAVADGFESVKAMVKYMEKLYGLGYFSLFNKLTLKWISRPSLIIVGRRKRPDLIMATIPCRQVK